MYKRQYVFQYVKNVEIHHAKITTKDAFWEVENVTISDSELNGEYLGWHSKNLRLVNCLMCIRDRFYYNPYFLRKYIYKVLFRGNS